MFLGFLGLVLCLNLSFKYYSYIDFLRHYPNVDGVAELVYVKQSKKGKIYQITKLKTPLGSVWTRIYNDEFFLKQNDFVSFTIKTDNVKFLDFLKGSFFAPTFNFMTKEGNFFKAKLLDFVASQHQDQNLASFYNALFLATPISQDIRKSVAKLGISHLVAISGFHLGVIYSVLFFVLKAFYKKLHENFFSYRNLNFDLGVLIFVILFFYMRLIDFAPSFVRAFVMSLFGFVLYMKHLKIVSFANLALCVGVILALMPQFIFSLGFWFSAMGVFYIFLYFKHFNFGKIANLLLLNCWIFFALIIPVHFFFGVSSIYQLLAILLSILFIVFYPLGFLAHLFNMGDIFDKYLLMLFSLPQNTIEVFTPLWLFVLYIFLSFASIFSKKLSFMTISIGFLFFILPL